MNVDLAPVQLEAFNHLNRAQKRAFILRDQLKYTEPHHLDIFIDGICNPEPPAYKRTGSGMQPPYVAVTIKESAKSFDLSNVELKNKQIKRIILKFVGDQFEIHDAEEIPKDDNNIDSIPINYMVARSMLPQFKAKIEAIHGRIQVINEMRQHMYEEARNKLPQALPRFKESQVIIKLPLLLFPSTF